MNEAGIRRDVIVLGASAGGVVALTELFHALPTDFPGAVVAVLHRSPHYETRLPRVLGRRAKVRVLEPADGEPFQPGSVYIAPRDQHLLIDGERLRLARSAKEHRTRPAIDPLFRSAAKSFGNRVVGVLLTGGGEDGVQGLITIKQAGGISIAQDPHEAPAPSMPAKAIIHDDVDAILTLGMIAKALVALAHGEPFGAPRTTEHA
jgi:two-component system chemotaxis response regulator CheB